MKHGIFYVFTAMAIIAIFGFIACGGDDGNSGNGDKDLSGHARVAATQFA